MSLLRRLIDIIPVPYRYTFLLRSFGFFQVPLIFAVRPSVVCLDEDKSILKIAYRRKIKNHLGSVYFGALTIAAECAGGIAVMKEIETSGKKISLIFKDFHAEFLKRAEADTYFTCYEIDDIKALVARVAKSTQRHELKFNVIATCPEKLGDEPVAKFAVTVSLKNHSTI